MDRYVGYSLNKVAGMLVVGIVLIIFGLSFTILSISRGEIVIIGDSWRVIVREKIKDIRPLRLKYFGALVFTLMFGPGLLIIGIISIASLISIFAFR